MDDPHTIVCEARFALHGLMDLFCAVEEDMPNGTDIYFLMKPILVRLDDVLEVLDKMPAPN